MNRQEAALVIKDRLNDEIWKQENGLEVFPVNMDAFRVAIKALRGPVPDPDTGLVPCGCGGVVEQEDFHDGFFPHSRVMCRGCWTETTRCRRTTEEAHKMAKIGWNTAMGWRGKHDR